MEGCASKHARVELHLRGQHLERGIVTAQDLGRGHLRIGNNTQEAPILLCTGIIMQGQLMKVPSDLVQNHIQQVAHVRFRAVRVRCGPAFAGGCVHDGKV